MKLLWETEDDDRQIALYIHDDGMYYLRTIQKQMFDPLGFGEPDETFVVLPPAKADELRVALLPGFDPLRDDPQAFAVAQEGPHPDD